MTEDGLCTGDAAARSDESCADGPASCAGAPRTHATPTSLASTAALDESGITEQGGEFFATVRVPSSFVGRIMYVHAVTT